MSEFFLYIKDGQITNKKTVASQFDLPDGSYLVTIKSKKHRSIPQNRYYWGVMVPEVKRGLIDVGYNIRTNEDAHEVIKGIFLKKEIKANDGPPLQIGGSTAELTTVEFNDLIAEVQQWAAEFLNVVIPDPNQHTVMFAEFDKEVNAVIVNDSY